MTESQLTDNKSKNMLCDTILYLYMLFMGVVYYSFYISSTVFTSVHIMTSDMERFVNLLDFSGAGFLAALKIKNLIYTLYLFLSKDSFFSFVWTAFTMFMISVFLVYKVANLYKPSRLYGLIAVFMFTTFPEILLCTFAVNVHLSAMMILLFVLYFYGKSKDFSNVRYGFFYVLFSLIGFYDRETFLIYLCLILSVSSYLVIKKKRYVPLIYNLIIVAVIAFTITPEKDSAYLLQRLEHWVLYFNVLDIKAMAKLPFLCVYEIFIQFEKGFSLFYLCLLGGCSLYRIFYPSEEKNVFYRFMELFLLLILGLFFFTVIPKSTEVLKRVFSGAGAVVDDILPIYAFLAIAFVNFIAIYSHLRKYIAILSVCLYLAFPLNFFDFSLTAFKAEEADVINNEKRYKYLLYDMADKTDFYLSMDSYKQYFFVLEKVESLFPTEDMVYTLNVKHVQLSNFFEDTSFYLEDYFTLQGYTLVPVSGEKASVLVDTVELNMENVCALLFGYKGTKSNLDVGVPEAKKLKTWKIQVNDHFLKLHFYGIKDVNTVREYK